jgi:hypothetical protein
MHYNRRYRHSDPLKSVKFQLVAGGGQSARSLAAWAAFRARVEELGGTVLEPEWLGVDTPHRIRCREGHYSTPRPTMTKTGGICRACAGQDPATAEAAFRARLAELGAVLLESKWLGSQKPHRVRCSAGHECAASPRQAKRGGVCITCAGKDPAVAEAKFRTRVAELGGTLLEPKWLGNNSPHRIRCAAGHEVAPHPGGVQRGQGICRICAGQVWDAFYVVADEVSELLKFGITSGDPRPRLEKHERAGFDTVLRLATSLPKDVAPELERNIRFALRDAGEQPAKGREYFPLRVQALVLDLVDNHPAIGTIE